MQRIKLVLESYLGFLRVCVRCGAYCGLSCVNSDPLKPKQLCQYCWNKLQLKSLKHALGGYSFRVKSLFSWDNDDPKLIRDLIIGMKAGGPKELFTPFAMLLCEQHVKLSRQAKTKYEKYCFVPAPRANGSQPDHAETLAQELARISGGEYCPALKRISAQKQKSKNEKDRKKLARESGFHVAEEWSTPIGKFKNQTRRQLVIFVDDVITTGATAKSAHQALAAPKNYEVWTIAHRPRLLPCELDEDLI